ncbi:uncharacterized protein LOC109613626 [Musca domestica]|uniref:Uncharacterized protein LOC109613626 n=1 Tax=Musca domestica TaxID=7370 RepID=A0ABM3VFQ8_MUSDO|nr:uncharacterized protein LOC109613626 [Musca domestica]
MRIVLICSLISAAYSHPLGYIYDQENAFTNPSEIDITNALPNDHSNESIQKPKATSAVEFDKQFYTFSAPEEPIQDNGTLEKILPSLKKKLRVVLIRTPDNQVFEDAAMNMLKQSADNHFAIYVLTKQTDTNDLVQKLQLINNENDIRPEVHFVKYRTHEDAENAQKIIQDQYNALPGRSETYQEEILSMLTNTNISTLVKAVKTEEKSIQEKKNPIRKYLSSRPRTNL